MIGLQAQSASDRPAPRTFGVLLGVVRSVSGPRNRLDVVFLNLG